MILFFYIFNTAKYLTTKIHVLGEIVLNEEDSLLVGSKITKMRKLEAVRYPCDKCEYNATEENDLKRHFESKHKWVSYPCVKCEYYATSQRYLREHIKNKHEGVKYPCDKCEFSSTTVMSLKGHIASIHEVVKYLCDKCEP